MNNNISDKDKKDWQNFLDSNNKLEDKDLIKKQRKNFSTKTIDLHGYSLQESNKIIENFINKNYEEKVNKLIVVTGKGLHSKNEKDPYASKEFGILRYSVPEYIKTNEALMKKIIQIKEADIKDGGSGAFYIYLKKLK
ncbi:Smr/MutS family protein [Candidatus Pelagibacter sp.]|uniref:Smr/MutS family protein n=1 Tax=Candidatus Pelagibacter sp. TaxID=2024849 RepID=UPI003F85D367